MMYGRASVECIRVGVCVTEWGVGITLRGAAPVFPGPVGRVREGGRSRQIYAPLGAEAAFAE